MDQRLNRYQHQIEQRVRGDVLSSRRQAELAGVGALSASALRVKVAEVTDFGNGRNFAAYIGLAPGHKGSGGKVTIGSIRRGHDRYLRQLLIHGARSAIYHLGNKQDAQSRWLSWPGNKRPETTTERITTTRENKRIPIHDCEDDEQWRIGRTDVDQT